MHSIYRLGDAFAIALLTTHLFGDPGLEIGLPEESRFRSGDAGLRAAVPVRER